MRGKEIILSYKSIPVRDIVRIMNSIVNILKFKRDLLVKCVRVSFF